MAAMQSRHGSPDMPGQTPRTATETMTAPAAPASRFFVIRGGPGAGKSTLINALATCGHAISEEAGRAIIQDQVAIGGTALPWADRSAFAEMMLSWDIRSYRSAERSTGPVFFDRGLPDVAGYLTLCGLAVPAHVMRAVTHFRYASTVFVAPPWAEIFDNDTERRQDFGEARRTFDAMVETYGRAGYSLAELPRAPVAARVAFVLETIGC